MPCAGGKAPGQACLSRLSCFMQWSTKVGVGRQCVDNMPNKVIPALLCSIVKHYWMSGSALRPVRMYSSCHKDLIYRSAEWS